MATPNMGLTLPVVGPGGTLSPTWASMLNTALTAIDAHNHAFGSGALVGAAGIGIDGDLPFNMHNAVTLRSTRYESQSSTFSAGADVGSIYVYNGDLYYRNISGTNVPITSGSAIAGPSGSILGLVAPASAVYSAFTDSFAFRYDVNKPGKLLISDVSLYEFGNATAQPVTLKSPAGVSAYSWTWPAAQAATQAQLVSISTAGQLAYGAPVGSLANPGMAFTGALSTGFSYAAGPSRIYTSVGGVGVTQLTANGLTIVDGSFATPSIGFASSPTSGWSFATGPDRLIASVDGGGYLTIRADGVVALGVPYLNTYDGTEATPAYGFFSEPSSGMWRPSATEVRFSVAGLSILGLSKPAGGVGQLLSYNNGGVNYPNYSFDVESDLGMGRESNGVVGFTNGGNWVAKISSAGIASGGDFLKWETYSLTVARSGGTQEVSISGTVLGATGYDTNNDRPIDTASTVKFDLGSDGSSVKVRNDRGGAGSDVVKLVVFYS